MRPAAVPARRRRSRRRSPIPPYPHALEREFEALARRVALMAHRILRRAMRAPLATLASQQRRADEAAPGWAGAILDARLEFMRWIEVQDIGGRLHKIGEQLDLFADRAIKRQLPAVIGIEQVTAQGITGPILLEWTREGVDLIKTIGPQYFDKIEQSVAQGFLDGRRHTSIAREIQRIGGVARRRAEFIARDQTAKLNGRIQEARQRALGGETYIWRASRDSRVRPRHAELDGTVQRWDDPPVLDERTGRRGHPGFDFQCRCRAELDVDTMLSALEAEEVPPAAAPMEFELPAAAIPEPLELDRPAVMQFVDDPLGFSRPRL